MYDQLIAYIKLSNWIYWAVQRPDDTSYGKGQGVITTRDGSEVAMATGRGEGRMTDSGKMRYPGAIFYSTNSKNKLPFLNHLIGVNEVDTSGIMNTDYGNGNKRSRIVIIQYIDFIIKQS